MSEMNSNESIERIRNGLRKAISCAQQLGKGQQSKAWLLLATQLKKILYNVEGLYRQGSLSDMEANAMVDALVAHKLLQEPMRTVQ